jgi:regulator of replication initiation timing
MKELLTGLVQAVQEQAVALGTVADHVTALKQTLARKFPEMADDLKTQIQADQEKSRTENYQLQVSLGKLREAIAQIPDAPTEQSKQPEQPKKRAPARRKVEAAAKPRAAAKRRHG